MDLRFVVHQHHASRLHFDFRLEREGVLRSWAVPRGPSMDPSQKRLAVEVDDHPLDYLEFEGTIPEGEYGAGRVLIWDRGTYRLLEEKGDKILFALVGEKLRGTFSLVSLKRGKTGKGWLLIKKNDGHAHKGWKLEPLGTVEPFLPGNHLPENQKTGRRSFT